MKSVSFDLVTCAASAPRSTAIRLMLREPGDRWEPFEEDRFTQGVCSELRARLGADTFAARRRSAEGAPREMSGAPRVRAKPIVVAIEAGIQEVFRQLATDFQRTAAIAEDGRWRLPARNPGLTGLGCADAGQRV